MADRQGAIRHAEAPASVAEHRVEAERRVEVEHRVAVERRVAEVAGIGN